MDPHNGKRIGHIRVFSTLFLLIPVLLLIVSAGMTVRSFRSVKEEIALRQLAVLNQARSDMEYRFVQHEEIANDIMISVFEQINDASVSNLQYDEYLQIRNILSFYANRGMVAGIRFYVPDSKSYSRQRDIFYPLSELENSDYADCASRGFHWIPTHNVRIAYGQVVPAVALMYNVSRLDDHNEMAGSLLLYIPVERLNAIFAAGASQNEEIFLADENGVTLAHNDGSHIGSSLLTDDDLKRMHAEEQGIVYGETYVLAHCLLGKTNWRLVSVNTQNQVVALDSSRLLLLGTMWIVALLSLAFVVLMLMYNSIMDRTVSDIQAIAQSFVPQESPVEREPRKKRFMAGGRLMWKLENVMQTMAGSIERYYQDRIELANYQMQSLQAQIKPHFLYNTLDIIKWMIVEGNCPDAIRMVNSLSKYLRMSINKTTGLATLSQEIELGQIYLDIIQKRFRNRFDTDFDLEEDVMECLLPKLLLQPIMENAVIHGLLYCEKENAMLRVRAWREDDRLCLEVEDNGNGIPQERLEQLNSPENQSASGYGLKNSRKRLQLFGGAEASMYIHSREGVGTCVSISLPAKFKEESSG